MTALHASALAAVEAAELALWCAEQQPEIIDAIDREATESTRDDGELFYGRLPSDDVDSLNPWTVARAPISREVAS